MKRCTRPMLLTLALLGLLTASFHVAAFDEPKSENLASSRAFVHPDLEISDAARPVGLLPGQASLQAQRQLDALGIDANGARVDARGGRFETLLPSQALISQRTPPGHSRAQRAASARAAFRDYLASHQTQLGVDPSQLDQGVITVHGDGDVVQIHMPRLVDGIPVRGSFVNGVINNGKLNLLGTHRWGDVRLSTRPDFSLEDAQLLAGDHLSPFEVDGSWATDRLILVPTAKQQGPGQTGNGYGHRLVWETHPIIKGDLGSWEVLVDAHSGEVISALDTNVYAEAKGGVLPVTNDGVVPDGVEQAGWPMPWLDVSTSGGTLTTDTGGNLAATGSLTSSLAGTYIRMNDNCGSISLTQTDGLDFGTSGGTDCVTPGFGGAGNTHASRTGFYELNRIKEMARAQLPSNSWLQQQLTSNMNINNTCNAFWNGSTVNFYRSGGGCANTGEIAGVFDHEWGHGLDANDAAPGIASPSGEGIADIYTALRLNDSCIGRNFRATPCTGNGDPCNTCTGVRDIDYLKRASGQPHDYTWSNANCGGSVHCVGGVYSEAVWSLWKRKLTAAPYNMAPHTAHELATRLTFLGAGATSTWFSGGPPFGGCSSSSGYMNYLAADDDNGNLNDGTPHMGAIYAAFNDQEIACNTPTVQDSGCANTPTVAPTVTTGNGNSLVTLSWNAVANASKYQVFRTEGVFACDFGKVKVGETTGTSFNDTGLQNGRDYSYVVIPIGAGGDSCMGPSSACATESPVGQPDFAVSCSPSSQALAQGDSGSATCTVVSSFGYTGNVALSCSGNPAGVGCSLSPSSVSPPADGSAGSTLTLDVDLGQATGTFAFDVVADDGSTTRTAGVSVQVIPEGSNGPQTAVYDGGLGAPRCSTPGSSCDSVGLLDGRGTVGPEPNQPNTLDTCTDGTAGSYHSDESNDRIVVRTLDGGNFAEGATVEVEVTVWAWSTGSSDTLDLYYTADANNPSWTLLGSFSPSGGGQQVLTTQYTLPTGSLQAVRANFRYTGTQSPCSGGTYDDADDLAFAVGTAGPGCTVDADCDNSLFCDGTETCNAGSCQAGTPVSCDDGVSCTVDSCDEGTDSCGSTADDGLCDNGLFCDGAETCDAVLDCQAGTAPNCNDGVDCTVDSCNEGTDSCDNATDDLFCSNGLFCDGSETCDAVLGCLAGAGDPCTGNEVCDEAGDVCVGSCAPKGDACDFDSDCCSGKCRGPAGGRSCK